MFAERAIAEHAAAVVLWDVDESALERTLDQLADAGVWELHVQGEPHDSAQSPLDLDGVFAAARGCMAG